MLGKLIKHELRHSARYHFAIFVATIAVTVVVGLSLVTDSSLLTVLSSLALAFTGVATIIITVVSIIKNFYDTMFTRLGYLTMTLPVKGSQLLLSKIIVAVIWVVAGFIAMAIPYSLMFFYARQKVDAFVDVIGDAITAFTSMLPTTGAIISFAIVMLVLAFLYIITYIGYIYFSVTIANTGAFQKRPKLYGGLTFFAILLFVTKVGSLIGQVVPLTFNISQEKAFFALEAVGKVQDAMLSYPIADTLFAAIVGIGLLFATGYIIENKINIK